MPRIVLLPGHGCRFWAYGHCWLPEAENPGWDLGLRCRVLAALVRTYEDTLTAHEAGVPGVLAAWSRWGDAVLTPPWDCLDFQAETGKDTAVCRFLRDSVCVLRLPVCAGRCHRFQPGFS